MNLSPAEPAEDFIPRQHLDYRLMRDLGPEAPANPQKPGENECLFFQTAKFWEYLYWSRKLIQMYVRMGDKREVICI